MIYRWICDGVGVNHASLSAFRVEHGGVLDRLMAQSLAALIAEGLLGLDEIATDGTKVRARWADKHPGAAKTAKAELRVSTTDPDVRVMRMADEAMRPCYNIQLATACGLIVGLSPTNQCNDPDRAGDLAGGMVGEVERMCGRAPARLLADAGAMTRGDIVGLEQTHPALVVYAPPVLPKPAATPQSQNRRAHNLAREASCLKQWRARMTTPQAKAIYARRCSTEPVHAKIKNRGFGRMPVRGLARVRAVCLLHALTHNMLHALAGRAALAAA